MLSSLPDGLLTCVRAQLVRPRELSVRVGGAVCGMLNVRDPLDGLHRDLLQHREPYEVEWLLSTLFTPTRQEREACEVALPPVGIDAVAVGVLVTCLSAEALDCPVLYGHREAPVPVMPVVIERYVRLLHLDAGIHPLLLPILQGWGDEGVRLVLCSLARRSVWHPEQRAAMLLDLLQTMRARDAFRVEKIRFLTDFVGSYRPVGKPELRSALVNLVEAYHQDTEHPIFNQQLEHYQGENLRSRYCGPDVKAYRLAMAHALLTDLDCSSAML
ncbi:MAG: hypothetical protein H7838_02845 [Magnetococcus sp. DMHC-8]